MCGIMGYYCFGDKKPDKQSLTTMFELLESRGFDASGFAFIRDDNLIVHKEAIRSSILVQSQEWNELALPQIFIAHTRMKTQGTEQNNNNNHPLFTKGGLCIVHNGMINNDEEIFTRQKRDGECDSEAILAVLSSRSKGDKIKQVFDKLEGSFAFALIDRNDPDKLVLVKKDNPLELYYDERGDILYFCSEGNIMKQSLGIINESRRGFNLGERNYHHYTMENNHALTINKDGVESYKRYAPKREERSYPRYYRNDAIMIECPFCLGTTVYHDGKIFNRCEHCGQPLSEDDLYV
jgi:glucosamine 6-phosphate synthetase-like amidotransferase/phosphosugar isomerase protein